MDLIDELLAAERSGWDALCEGTGAEFYGTRMTDDGMMILAHGLALDRSEVVVSLRDAPPWSGYDITDVRLIRIAADAAAITYMARAWRGGDDSSHRPDVLGLHPRRGNLETRPVPADPYRGAELDLRRAGPVSSVVVRAEGGTAMSVPDPNIRLSNAQREALIGRLHAAAEEGRLDLDEFAERSREVYEAKTYADIAQLFSDLPEEDRAPAVSAHSKAVSDVPDLVLNPVHSRVVRRGAWTVPARITINPVHSGTKLDCRDATFAAGDIEIELDVVHSGVTLILPPNASAVDDGVQLTGGRVVNHCQQPVDGPRFHLTGRTQWGRVTVRYERRFLWWRWLGHRAEKQEASHERPAPRRCATEHAR